MPDAPDPDGPPVCRDSDAAPIVYFDFVPTYGTLGGVIGVDLATRHLVHSASGSPHAEFVTRGRLRCSPAAARSLIEALHKALEMLSQPREDNAGSTLLN